MLSTMAQLAAMVAELERHYSAPPAASKAEVLQVTDPLLTRG